MRKEFYTIWLHFIIQTLGGHVDVIKKFYTELYHYLTRTLEIGNTMIQYGKLTPAEHEGIFKSKNVYTNNDKLLKLLFKKSSDVYDCFVEALAMHQQTHLYQLLHTSGKWLYITLKWILFHRDHNNKRQENAIHKWPHPHYHTEAV